MTIEVDVNERWLSQWRASALRVVVDALANDSALKRTAVRARDVARALRAWLTWEWVFLTACVAFAIGTWRARAWRRHTRKMLAQLEMKHSLDSAFTTVETGSMEWVNLAMRHAWTATLSAFADEQASDVLREVIEKMDSKPSFVKEIELISLTLGATPPTIKLYTTRYNPTLDYFQFEFDLDWATNSAHGRLMMSFKLAKGIPTLRVPVHLTDFGIRGKLLIGMHLTQRIPAISGADVSFRAPPKLDVSVRPVGLPVSDVPGLHEWVMAKLEKVICKKFLEPKRLYVDMEGKFFKKMKNTLDFLGPGGTLVVRLNSVKGMPFVGSGYPYFEIAYNGKRKKTPTRPHATHIMEYGVALHFPMPPDTEWIEKRLESGEVVREVGRVRVRAVDRSLAGSDLFVIGESVFVVEKREGKENKTHSFALSLGSHNVSGKYGDSKRVALMCQMEWEVLPPLAKWSKEKPAVAQGRSKKPTLEPEPEYNSENSDDDDDERDERNDGGDGKNVFKYDESRSGDAPNGASAVAVVQKATVATKVDVAGAAEHFLQIAKLRGMLHSEKVRGDEAIAALKNELRVAKEGIMLERERRAQELKRALLEGVPFLVHSKNRYAELKGGGEAWYMRYHGMKQVFSLHRKYGVKSRPIHHVHISNVASAVTGTKHYTLGVSSADDAKEKVKAKQARAASIKSLPDNRCLTIVFLTEEQARKQFEEVQESKRLTKNLDATFEENAASDAKAAGAGDASFKAATDLTSTGLRGLDLEIPFEGNGRSAREWVDAINTLRSVFIATEYSELKNIDSLRSKSKSSLAAVAERSEAEREFKDLVKEKDNKEK